MAKGNLFQGMARGKVGDVVFYRMNGVQMSRVRNRTPKNPRTNEQLYQRAVIASVMKLYSAGKAIFDHAFQGYTIGEGCMRRFNSVNARIVREQVASEVNGDVALDSQLGRVVAPKCLSFTPMVGVMISEGTLEQSLFTWNDDGSGEPPTVPPDVREGRADAYYNQNGLFSFAIKGGTADAGLSVNALFAKMGIYAGDIFTFCLCNFNRNEIVSQTLVSKLNYATIYKSYFEWVRLIVKSDIADTVMVSTAKYSDVFDIEIDMPTTTFDAGQELLGNVKFTYAKGILNGTIGCIRSRLDVDLRSTSYMMMGESNFFGIAPSYIVPAWANDVQKIGTSELILEGGEEYNYNELNLLNADNTPIQAATVDENATPKMARHKGTRNNKK